jgi:hypothetical protein
MRYLPAGLSSAISPAGEMWSVVTESPNTARTRRPERSFMDAGLGERFMKNGGSLTYVEDGTHAKHSSFGMGSPFHSSSPSNTAAYSFRNMSAPTEERTASVISSGVGQISRSMTGRPFGSKPTGSLYRSTSMFPARA